MSLLAYSFDWHRDAWMLVVAGVWMILISALVLRIGARQRKVNASWKARASMTRVRFEFADGNACEMIGSRAQEWHHDMFFLGTDLHANPLSNKYPWKVAVPIGEIAIPTHAAEEVEAWAHGQREDKALDEIWLVFVRLFYQHERFEPNRRDSRVQDLLSWFYRGCVFASPVRILPPVCAPKTRWWCRRCNSEVDTTAGRCECESSPSPWEPFTGEAPAASEQSPPAPPSPAAG